MQFTESKCEWLTHLFTLFKTLPPKQWYKKTNKLWKLKLSYIMTATNKILKETSASKYPAAAID